ncbi:MAG: hypothetical protein ACYCT1_14815, partial [Steroidobacteraceae bacterium]
GLPAGARPSVGCGTVDYEGNRATSGRITHSEFDRASFLDPSLGAVALNDLSTWVNWTVPLMITEVALQVSRMRVQTGVAA